MEKWKSGKVEEWKSGKVEEWKNGVARWKVKRSHTWAGYCSYC